MESIEFEGRRVALAIHPHAADDDLLSAGLGLQGLQVPLASPQGPLDWRGRRRRAIQANWQGIAYLAAPHPVLVDALARPICGRELQARLHLPGAPAHRVMLQIPEQFDPARPRLLLTATSGSRGVFGAVALASAWGLPRGYAVVHTDKGCGTDWYDVDRASSPDLLGAMTDDPVRQLFRPDTAGLPPHCVLTPHAHSMGHPEAHWGDYLHQAMRFAWTALDALFPAQRPSAASRRRCLAVGLSNGGAAVLRALERPQGIDGAVVLAPNVLPRRGGRAFLDYAAEAALWLPLALQVPALADRRAELQAFAPQALERYAEASQRALHALGRAPMRARSAWRLLRRRGWPAHTLASTLLSTSFDFWGSAGHTYTAALSRCAAARTPLGSHFAALDDAGQPRAASEDEADLWWSDGAGIVPGAGVGIVEHSPRSAMLARLHRLLHGGGSDRRIAAGIRATRCGPPGGDLPITLVHGLRDGLIPAAFSSLPWARMARAAGAQLDVRLPADAPHFDAFLALPGYNRGLQPLLPYGFEALDQLAARLDSAC